MRPIRVFVVDDHTIFRWGVRSLLEDEPEFDCVGEAASGAEALVTAPALAPDLVLTDFAMPGMDGVALVQALQPHLPKARFAVLASGLDAADARRALAVGVTSVLDKTTTPQELLTALQATGRGQRVFSPSVADALASPLAEPELGANLTPRERGLLALMARGMDNRGISTQLSIAMPTVKFHVTNIMAKLNAGNRTTAVLKALRHKIVQLD